MADVRRVLWGGMNGTPTQVEDGPQISWSFKWDWLGFGFVDEKTEIQGQGANNLDCLSGRMVRVADNQPIIKVHEYT